MKEIHSWLDYVKDNALRMHDFTSSKLNYLREDGVLCEIAQNPDILDYGCGDGQLGIKLAARTNAGSLDQASIMDNRIIKVTDIPFIPIEHNCAVPTDKRYDIILICDVLQYVDETERLNLLRDLAKKNLKPTGKIIVIQYNTIHKGMMRDFRDFKLQPEAQKDPSLSQVVFLTEHEPVKLREGTFKIVKSTSNQRS